MKKQESNRNMTETTKTNAIEKKTFADWLIQTVGASAIAGISAMSGSSDGGDVYRNMQR